MDHLPQYLLPGQEGDVLEEREKETDIIIRLDMRYRRLPETVTDSDSLFATRDAEFMYKLIRGAISVAFSSFLSGSQVTTSAPNHCRQNHGRRRPEGRGPGLRQGKSDVL